MKLDDEIFIADAKMDVDQIREELYKNGFKLKFENKKSKKMDVIEYVFWYRTPSKSRIGDVVFINKTLLDKIRIWQRMGIKLPEGKAKVVEMMAYESLTSSNIIGKIEIIIYKW